MVRRSIVPMYQQMVDDIKQKIQSGEWKENERIMTEAELEEAYAVSRITVRKAINVLAEEGFVTKKQGIGTFVTANAVNRVISNKLLSFTEMCAVEGKEASAEILSVQWVKADAKVAKYIQIEKNDRVIRIDRLRKADGNPVMIEQTYLSEKYGYVMEEDLTGSLYAILRQHGTNPIHASKTIEICYPTAEEQEILGVEKKQPLLLHSDQVSSELGEPILYSKLIVNPERYKLTIII